MSWRLAGLAAIAALVVGAGVLVLSVPPIQWRAQLIVLQARGEIYDLSWSELLRMIVPRSGYYLEDLVETRNPFGTIENPYETPEDVEAGEAVFRTHCANCHGTAGTGGVGPALDSADLKHGDTDWWLYRAMTRGIPGTAMVGRDLDDREAWQVVAYIRSIEKKDPSLAELEGPEVEVAPVGYDRLLAGRAEARSWLTYSGDYDGKRYSDLAEIDAANAGDLKLLWMHQTDAVDEYLETSPIVNDGVMYITDSPGGVHALDAATGVVLWSFNRPVPERLSLCCGHVNRGVAILGDTVYWATIDSHLLALDARTGEERWQVEVAEHEAGYTITSAPLVVKDLVLIGVSGGEYGIRGHLDAYRASTGERVWRFYTIPAPGEPGSETWSGDSWKTGGAGAWLTGSFDPELNLLYWGTGNPGPLYHGDTRLGDNLYANSVVALDVDTGEMRWYFQFTPHDLHDWAANQIPVLVDRPWEGEERSLLLTANRNGFFYALDRETGEYLMAEPFVKQNWAVEIDADGRPVLDDNAIPTPEGTITWPSPHGGTNWQSPAYSPRTDLFYVPALDGGRIVYKQGDTPRYERGEFYIGSMHQMISRNHPLVAKLRAIDPDTGEVVWSYDNPPRDTLWRTGGVLATAGDIVVGGDFTSLYALDARDGRELWRMNVGGYVNAAPITYEVEGRQQITVAAGRSILTFGLPTR
ncbi:MAG: PQQ-dependent dehydrogenase, methanol/ethanol family [Myxococcota bacterium]